MDTAEYDHQRYNMKNTLL